jgi:hypothetical protein
MIHRLIVIALLSVSFNSLFAQETKMLGSGVLFPKDDFKEINILNSDRSNYLKLIQSSEGEIKVSYQHPIQESVLLKCVVTYYPYYYLEYTKFRIPLPKIAIRAFYTDENVIVFDALKIDNGYKIFINGNWKIVKFNKSVVYEDWNTYIKRIYVTANKQHPLYKESNEKSLVVNDNDKYSFKVLEVKQDWIKVECSKECEGCPENKILKGWIKWKDKDMIIIKLFYAC